MPSLSDVRVLHQAHPVAFDVLLAVALMPIVVLVPDSGRADASPLSGAAAVVAVLTCAGLAFRRRHPAAVLVGTVVGAAVVILLDGGPSTISFVPFVALYSFAAASGWIATVLGFAGSALGVGTAVALATTPWPPDPQAFQHVSSFAVAAAVGMTVRARRAYVEAVEERAERAERTREQEAARRVAEERLRIARELHDVIAHRVAIVNVQASVARHLVLADPPAALTAIEHVRDAGRAILDELGDVLNVLRQQDEEVDPHSPAPGLAQVQHLIASFRAAGMSIRQSVSGSPRAIAGGADLVAYRVLQEALTNAHKHGTGPATMSICYESTGVELEVTNPVGDREADDHSGGAGFGLIGMRERVAAVGGQMMAGHGPGGRFEVSVRLPDREGVHT
ncbi:two-component sensor histidine kinase [Aeromicrobium sp. SMF47]|uniref:sensor histidine kinase n=1 Tax=Aeromicrobium TaxID=2040 RepID=UPI00129D3D20|nr:MULTISPECIES: histidine kinase [Aeromicrobium]MRJ77650.1 two-component sensor histidine kinase [Aeromicrobium yanjiei]MRK02018.1 two-component sensor histidine kinase [Aeromicrobium sp. S22]